MLVADHVSLSAFELENPPESRVARLSRLLGRSMRTAGRQGLLTLIRRRGSPTGTT